MKQGDCERCRGCGSIANTPRGEPWVIWANLPYASAAAVATGLVAPITCPACGGTGLSVEELRAQDVDRKLGPVSPLCPLCEDRGWRHRPVVYQLTKWIIERCVCQKLATSSATRSVHDAMCECGAPMYEGSDQL